MNNSHASKQHLNDLPPELEALFFPPSTKPERFIAGKAVKGRNEPCATGGVAFVISKLLGVPLETVAEKAFENTVELFDLKELRV